MVTNPTQDVPSAEQVEQPLWHAYAVEYLGETSKPSFHFARTLGCVRVLGGRDFVWYPLEEFLILSRYLNRAALLPKTNLVGFLYRSSPVSGTEP